MARSFTFILVWIIVVIAAPVSASPIEKDELPPVLQPWVDWVLFDHVNRDCPVLYNVVSDKHCSFPTTIDLRLDENGGTFVQVWRVYQKSAALTLPGSEKHWPQEVMIAGKRAAVVESAGRPAVHVESGIHRIEGRFYWDSLPHAIQVPEQTGLVNLRVGGKSIGSPQIGEDGRLFLQQEQATLQDSKSDSLEIRVYRHVADGVPMHLTTMFDLIASGQNREITLTSWGLDGFIPMEVISSLPVRIDAKGDIRTQIRPGRWTIKVTARSIDNVTKFKRPPVVSPLPENEIWVFEPNEAIRLVTVEGVQTIDSSQTTLPEEWQRLAAYHMTPDATLVLDVKKRGNPDPAPDQLTLQRTIWLDFGGTGYTMKDRLDGVINRSWRLAMNEPSQLGRVSVNGQSQLITTTKDGKPGVQLTQGQLRMEADSRVNTFAFTLPAAGWDVDLQSLSADLVLPPGWRMFWASGVDAANGTWLSTWNLLDLFILLVFAVAIGKLRGRVSTIVALLGLGLLIPEQEVFQYIFLLVLPALALQQYLKDGRVKRMVHWYRWGLGILLIAFALPFSVNAMRQAIFPTLEKPHGRLVDSGEQKSETSGYSKGGVSEKAIMDAVESSLVAPLASRRGSLSVSHAPQLGDAKKAQNLQQYDPKANIQTGPGVPQWQWNSIRLKWNGPVTKDQVMSLWLIPPWLNFVLALLRVVLLFVMIAMVLGFDRFWRPGIIDWKRWGRRKGSTVAAVLAVLMGSGAFDATSLHAQTPSPELLKQLRERLIKDPDCSGVCASVQRLRLEIAPQSLVLRMEVNAITATVIPLPGHASHWLPAQVLVDGGAARSLERRDGTVWLAISAGAHQVQLSGALPMQDSVQIALPMKPGYTSAHGSGWTTEGLHADGQVDSSLILNRNGTHQREMASEGQVNASVNLPPFVKVDRVLSLGLEWLVETTITRMTAGESAVQLSVPLLPGEQVTTQDVRVRSGKVQLALAPNQDSFRWESTIKPVDKLVLEAADVTTWMETWRVDLSPIWHLTTEGIPVVAHQTDDGQRQPFWQPWPGEKVSLRVSRPKAVKGATVTIDKAELTVTPGLRSTENVLDLSVRASLGRDYILTLPDGATFQSLSINGRSSVIKPKDRKLTIGLQPGEQTIQVRWLDDQGIALSYRTPVVASGTPGVNATLKVNMPRDRWILWLHGDGAGPAILFWSKVLILLMASILLGQIRWTPLRSYHWFLLGIGLSQIGFTFAILIAGFFIGVGYRGRTKVDQDWYFNLRQLILWCGALLSAIGILLALQRGFFGRPEMQIIGNGSSFSNLNWFVDRYSEHLPRSMVISVPMLVYKIAMLLWSLWLAFALMGWVKWIWERMGVDGFWRAVPPAKTWVGGASNMWPKTPSAPKDDGSPATPRDTE